MRRKEESQRNLWLTGKLFWMTLCKKDFGRKSGVKKITTLRKYADVDVVKKYDQKVESFYCTAAWMTMAALDLLDFLLLSLLVTWLLWPTLDEKGYIYVYKYKKELD
jgi:hypothetical protein